MTARTRWILFVAALGIAALAGWMLLATPGGEPLGEIDSASREKLERVLEEAGAR